MCNHYDYVWLYMNLRVLLLTNCHGQDGCGIPDKIYQISAFLCQKRKKMMILIVYLCLTKSSDIINMKLLFLYMISFVLFAIELLSSCQSERGKRLHYALEFAGENRVELEKVLKHYKNDTLKLWAAEYLIMNMPYHYTLDTYLLSPNGEKLIVDVDDFDERGQVYWYLDSLYKAGYKQKAERHEDIQTLHAEFLIRNIDLAFRMWRKPWAKDVPFDVFVVGFYLIVYKTNMSR